jgi:hypothetical protein
LNLNGRAVVDLVDALDTELEREQEKKKGKAVLVLSLGVALPSVQMSVGGRRKRWGTRLLRYSDPLPLCMTGGVELRGDIHESLKFASHNDFRDPFLTRQSKIIS